MRAIINDISFGYKFVSKEAAVGAFHEWLDICKELMQGNWESGIMNPTKSMGKGLISGQAA